MLSVTLMDCVFLSITCRDRPKTWFDSRFDSYSMSRLRSTLVIMHHLHLFMSLIEALALWTWMKHKTVQPWTTRLLHQQVTVLVTCWDHLLWLSVNIVKIRDDNVRVDLSLIVLTFWAYKQNVHPDIDRHCLAKDTFWDSKKFHLYYYHCQQGKPKTLPAFCCGFTASTHATETHTV